MHSGFLVLCIHLYCFVIKLTVCLSAMEWRSLLSVYVQPLAYQPVRVPNISPTRGEAMAEQGRGVSPPREEVSGEVMYYGCVSCLNSLIVW